MNRASVDTPELIQPVAETWAAWGETITLRMVLVTLIQFRS